MGTCYPTHEKMPKVVTQGPMPHVNNLLATKEK